MAVISKYYLIDMKGDQPIMGVDDNIEGIVKQWERTHQQYVIMTPVTWRTEITDITNQAPTTTNQKGGV